MSDTERMTVIVVRPERTPEVQMISHNLKTMQELVGGSIQGVYPFPDDVALVCNDEGKLLGLPLNRCLADERGEIYDIISGDFFLCRAPADSDRFESLTEEQITKYMKRFRYPEVFIETDRGIMVMQRKPKERGYER